MKPATRLVLRGPLLYENLGVYLGPPARLGPGGERVWVLLDTSIERRRAGGALLRCLACRDDRLPRGSEGLCAPTMGQKSPSLCRKEAGGKPAGQCSSAQSWADRFGAADPVPASGRDSQG